MKADVSETILMVPASTLPGTDPELLARRLADAVVHLPVPAAALIGTAEVPPDIQRIAQEYGERQGMWEAATDSLLFLARIWHRADDVLPRDPVQVAIAVRAIWDERVRGAASGLASVSVLPVPDPDAWLLAARRSPWVVATVDAQPGLLPSLP